MGSWGVCVSVCACACQGWGSGVSGSCGAGQPCDRALPMGLAGRTFTGGSTCPCCPASEWRLFPPIVSTGKFCEGRACQPLLLGVRC